MNDITKIETETPQVPALMTPMAMIDRALMSGATPETLEKLLTLQERWEAAQARKAFISSMAAARTKFAPILKTNDGYSSRYKYETLTDVMDAVDGPLNEHGFSYDWITEDIEGGRIKVTCVITHEAGHSRRNSLSGDPKDTADAKANMNGLQRMGGAVTYLQRYTLKAALGVAASKDVDGKTAANNDPTINADQFTELMDLLDKSNSKESAMLEFYGVKKVEDMTVKNFESAKIMMNKLIAKMAAVDATDKKEAK